MKIIIHRGTNQIGGCATEYRTKNTKIIIDFGAELDGELGKPLDISGVTCGKSDCDAVLFTHYHGDHVGLMETINGDIPLYIGDASKGIIRILNDRLQKSQFIKSFSAETVERIRTFKPCSVLTIGDIKITPFMIDHSAYDAYMFLIEADSKRILHTGDFRTHGFRGKGLVKVIKKYIGNIHGLVCEGTTLSRTDEKCETENELISRIKEVIRENKYVFVVCSSTNIDRIAGICAAVQNGKYCVCDEYQKQVIDYVKEKASKYTSLYKFNKVKVYGKNLDQSMREKGFCMFVRCANPRHKTIMQKYKDLNPLIIYSMWSGYLQQPEVKNFVDGFRWVHMHTSGHADANTIKGLINLLNPDFIVPMHTELPEKFIDISDNRKVLLLNDADEIDVGGCK